MLTKKQNVFDDFITCAEHLIKRRYTVPGHLAIEGGSNGGLLMGAVLTQRPELFRAVVAHVGIFDSLRAELETNGMFNTTEFGTVRDPAQFRALHAYSPYHHVTDGTHYPAGTLRGWGERQPRESLPIPQDGGPPAGRQQFGEPVLLRTNGSSGHNMTRTSDIVELLADSQAFMLDMAGDRADG